MVNSRFDSNEIFIENTIGPNEDVIRITYRRGITAGDILVDLDMANDYVLADAEGELFLGDVIPPSAELMLIQGSIAGAGSSESQIRGPNRLVREDLSSEILTNLKELTGKTQDQLKKIESKYFNEALEIFKKDPKLKKLLERNIKDNLFDTLMEYYIENEFKYQEWVEFLQAEGNERLMLKYIPKNKDINILDSGSGDGYWAQKLIEQGYKHITLLDISEKMLDEAKIRLSKQKEEFEAQYIKWNIIDMKELESDMFDYIFSQYNAVSYCLKPELALKEIARVVKEHGYVSVTLDTKFRRVPEYIESNYLEEAKILLKTNISNELGFLQYNLEWEELVEYFEAANLEVIEVVGAPVFMHQMTPEIL
ncbi:MAG: class I SAM-dependent methyltransferase [Candidatus Thorarchaeota archaeon]